MPYDLPWDREYGRDVWRLRELGLHDRDLANIRFTDIAQPWLKDLAKRWTRWRLSIGRVPETAGLGVLAINRFSEFLSASAPQVRGLAEVNRPLLERYLAHLQAKFSDTRTIRRHMVGQLNLFFTAIRQHRWSTSLPSDAMFFPEDFPKEPKALPRALSEHVMAQLEHRGNLDQLPPVYQRITLVLMRCGLRINDALRLRRDCIVHDANSAPYLRYYNHKMRREALVPIDEELERLLIEHRTQIQDRLPTGDLLFPRPANNPDGTTPIHGNAYRNALKNWVTRCEIRDEHGQPVHLTPHQWRHTLGTRLINRDVPQEVVRRILDHDSPEMTARYAQLNDVTIRRHWEAARKVDINGDPVTLDPDGRLAEAAWAKQRVGHATQALPNGYCGLPVVKTCPHANACLTCPMFITTPEFLPQHRQQRQQLLQIVSAAEARGQLRVVEMNQQVLGNLDRIITALDTDEAPNGTAVNDAS